MEDPAGPPPIIATSKSGLVITNASSSILRMILSHRARNPIQLSRDQRSSSRVDPICVTAIDTDPFVTPICLSMPPFRLQLTSFQRQFPDAFGSPLALGKESRTTRQKQV